MARPLRISILLGAGILCFVAFLILYYGREPAYHHRALSQWLTVSRSSNLPREKAEEAADAIRHIGTNGLPLLLAWASEEPPEKGFKLVVRKLPNFMIPSWLGKWAQRPNDITRANEARLGLCILGAQAAPLIPELARLANDPANNGPVAWAAEALGNIGPAAFPALIQILTNSQSPARYAVISSLTRFGTNALPGLVCCLDDTNEMVSSSAVRAIGRIGLEPAISVPALTKCLRSPIPATRADAAFALAEFGAEARTALPELEAAVSKETDSYANTLLYRAIRKLGGESPAKPISP